MDLTDAVAAIRMRRRPPGVATEEDPTTPIPHRIPSPMIPTSATPLRRGAPGSARNEAPAERAAAGRTPTTGRTTAMRARTVTARRRGRRRALRRSKSLSTWLRRQRRRFVWRKKIERDVSHGVPLDEFTVKAERKNGRD